MTTNVVNLRERPQPEHDVYAGRSYEGIVPRVVGVRGWLGNPFPYDAEGFETYFLVRVDSDGAFRAAVLACRGKKLGCFCAEGKWCHARFVARWIDAQPKEVTHDVPG